MRHAPAARILDLALALTATAEGLTTDEIAQRLSVSRRTVERLLASVEELFGPLTESRDGAQKRYRLEAHSLGPVGAPSAEELAELGAAVTALRRAGHDDRADRLERLSDKLAAAMRRADRVRLAPDVEALQSSMNFISQAGPRARIAPEVMSRVAGAILAQRRIAITYGPDAKRREIEPFGLLFGVRTFLVGRQADKLDAVLWRLDRMDDIVVTDTPAPPPPDFSVEAYADRAFGVFQEKPVEVVLRFSPDVAAAVDRFHFHGSQIVHADQDGGRTVTFTAGGLLEIAWHVITWRGAATVIRPEALREQMKQVLADGAKSLDADSNA